jgi:type I restriction enzyme S subunit
MTLLEFFKKVNPSVLAAKMIFRYLKQIYPVFKISEIADTSSGGTPNRGMIDYYNGEIPWVKSGELNDNIITNCEEYITELGLKNSSAKLFSKGTLLVAMYGANIGKTGVLDFDATTNQAVCAIFPKVDISMEFLFWYFKQQRIDFIAIGKGGAQPNISQTIINNASIVVPNKEVQQKIVSFLDNIEKGKGIDENFFIQEVLKDVRQIYNYKNAYVNLSNSFLYQLSLIDNFNKAILQDAVKGKLVAQNPQDEPASELLKRIKAEKAKANKKEKPLPPINKVDIPFEVPKNWVWVRLGDITNIVRGGSPRPAGDKQYYDGDIPFLKVGDLTNGNDVYLFNYTYTIKKAGLYKTRFVEANTLMLTNSGATLGYPKICTFPTTFNDGIAAFLDISNDISKVYLFYFLKSLTKWFLKEASRGQGQPNLNIDIISLTLFPMPPKEEQIRIVSELEKQLSKTAELKARIQESQAATEQLLKALLHEAFEVK